MYPVARTNSAIAKTTGIDSNLADKWIQFVDASEKTINTYKTNIRQFFKFLASMGITRPTRETVLQYRAYLSETCKPATVQGYIVALRQFFQWTELEGLYPNVATRVKGAKLDNREHKKDYLTGKQAQQLLGAIDRSTLKGKRDYAILAVMLTTGLRTISIIRANVGDMRVSGHGAVLYYQGKGRSERAEYVKLAEPVELALREYLAARGEHDAKAPLFASTANLNNGGRLTTRTISKLAKASFAAIGLISDRITAHSLRHTAATLNLLNGGSLAETQQLLGHQNINTTMIYSHALERANNESENRIAQAIFA